MTLEATGLVTALRDLAAKAESMFRVSCLFVSEDEVLVHDNTVATHLYRIAQEAITNAVKHGKAKTIVWNRCRPPRIVPDRHGRRRRIG